MTRADVRSFALLAPLALGLVIWWLFRADTCLDTQFSNVWRKWYPPVPVEYVAPPPGARDSLAVVENPYGISTCHQFPDAFDHAVTFTLLALIALFIGILCARRFRQHAETYAAGIAFGALGMAGTLQLVAYLPSNLDYYRREDYRPLLFPIAFLFLVAFAAGALAWLAARLTLRWRARG